ncbi:MAG: class I SAM-dependent methyltransferase [Candidatus Omnitrophota bacterium]|nr:class I SAM-dependent methyltransferase [Candidatus Omnitrophota bacterium]
MTNSAVYRHPRYYAIGYRWNTEAECRFIEACLKAYGPSPATRLLDLGCGSGRHMTRLAKQGYHVTGVDLSPEMVAYALEEARKAPLDVSVSVDDIRHLKVQGSYDAAFCFMDTFRFLLTNEEIIAHLRTVAHLLAPGGLYLIDFWVPNQWEKIGNEVHQWEQAEGETIVRVFYLQHPNTIDPITQTFEDELVFQVVEGDQTQEIRGGPTPTRLIMPQEFRALVDAAGVFELLATHGDFDLTRPFDGTSLSWRMISVLRTR